MNDLPDLARFAHDPRVWIGAGAAGVLLVGTAIYQWRNRPPTTDDLERQRRLHVNQVGRIAEGQVVELAEHEATPPASRGIFGRKARPVANNRARQLVSYSYAISGVTYHTAQDITGLQGQIRFERLVAGQPASVKYDPANPSDSILVADDWSGLR